MTDFLNGLLFGFGMLTALVFGLPVLSLMAFMLHEIEKRWKR